jgi:type I restriction enzyme S subunit
MMHNAVMQGSGVEWIGAIPQGWKIRIIKREFDIKLGKMLQPFQKTELDTEEYYLKTSNVYWDGVEINDIKKMWFSPLDKLNTELQYNDLLVCEGGDVGRSALWKEEITPCYIQNAINRVRPIHHCSTKFLYYWLFLLKHTGYIDAMVSRITIAHLTAEKLERLIFLSPPILEQQAIAQYLELRCGKLDAIIAIKQQQIKALDALRQSIIFHAVTKGLDASVPLIDSGVEWLGEIPQGWKVKIIKREFGVKLGKMLQPLQKSELDSEEYYLKTSNIYWEGVDIANINKMWFSPLDKLNTELQLNDLLVCEGGDVGRSTLWKEEITPCYIQNAINRVRPIHHCSTKFLYYWLFLLKHTGYIDAMVSRITIAHLTAEKLERLIFLLPPSSDQQRIADHLDQETQRLNALKENLSQQISTLQAYKKALIYECVTGKKRINADVLNAG